MCIPPLVTTPKIIKLQSNQYTESPEVWLNRSPATRSPQITGHLKTEITAQAVAELGLQLAHPPGMWHRTPTT